MIPGEAEDTDYGLHLMRYLFAATYAKGRRVLDAACGVGYGAFRLAAAGARRVVGIDVSPAAIAYARSHFPGPGLTFEEMDVSRLTFPVAEFDLVVSFETIEHLSGYEDFLDHVHRVLRPGGRLIISTPNKLVHPLGHWGTSSPYHVIEFFHDEFLSLLEQRFSQVRMLGQTHVIARLSAPETAGPREITGTEAARSLPRRPLDVTEVLCFLALCRKGPAGGAPRVRNRYFLFSDGNVARIGPLHLPAKAGGRR